MISNASCTTNCLAPLVKPLHDKIGVVSGLMTTVHAYTNDQVLTDVYHEDLRRARSATMSMIPTKTGAAAAVGLVLPELNGKLDGYAIRVPTINVSVVDLSFIAARDTSVKEVDAVLKEASEGELKGILDFNTEPLVSVDFNHNPASSTYDATLDQGQRPPGEGLELVRQRVGLLQPDARHHRRADGGEVDRRGDSLDDGRLPKQRPCCARSLRASGRCARSTRGGSGSMTAFGPVGVIAPTAGAASSTPRTVRWTGSSRSGRPTARGSLDALVRSRQRQSAASAGRRRAAGT